MSKKLIIGCCLVSALISTGVGMMFASSKPVVGHLPDFSALIEKDGPGVVHIRTIQKATQIQTGTPAEIQAALQSFFTPQPVAPLEGDRGIGSGFFISKDGYLLTNAHVVNNAAEVIITLTDHRQFRAEVLGIDMRTDVALLKVNADEDLPYIDIGSSKSIKVGQWVFAIGSPFNLENTATAGIISATARDAGEYLPLIQSDVSINPGNSGGPLIDIHGEVIGINSQILQSVSGGSAGISFAVPIDEAMRIAEQLKKHGKVARGRLGIQIGEPDVTLMTGTVGSRVVSVDALEKGGPADKAGIQEGDIILRFNNELLNSPADLPWRVGASEAGSTIKLTIYRNEEQFDVDVVIEALEENAIQHIENMEIVP